MKAWQEEAWLVRYLDRQLPADEAAWFEAYALDKPALLDLIEADTYLRDALAADKTIRSDGGAAKDANGFDGSSGTGRLCSLIRYLVPRPANEMQWRGLAATLMFGLGIGWLTAQVIPSLPRTEAVLVASPTRIVYDPVRGKQSQPRVEYPESNSNYVFVEASVPPSALNVVVRAGGAMEHLPASSEGFVSFLVARRALTTNPVVTLEYTINGQADGRRIELEPLRRQ